MKLLYFYFILFIILYITYKLYSKDIMQYNSYVECPFLIPKTDTSKGDIINNVPLKIFLTWETRNIPINMYNNILLLHKMNPEFDIYLYDENDRLEFITKNFNNNILSAYYSLIPGAYKADLWRYCIIYKYGGVYIDIKYHTYIPLLDFINESEFTFTHVASGLCKDSYDGNEIQNTFYISSPNNKIFIDTIEEIYIKSKNKDYGQNKIDITGPCVLTRNINKIYGKDFDKYVKLRWKYRNDDNVISIYKRNTNILVASSYIEYRNDQKTFFKNNKIKDYRNAYKDKTVFS